MPGDLFDERVVTKLLSEVPPDVDHVVLHMPPVLAATETSLLAEHAHLLVLVVALGHTNRRDLATALAELRDRSPHILGAVLCEPGRGKGGPRSDRGPATTGAMAARADDRGEGAARADGNGHPARHARPDESEPTPVGPTGRDRPDRELPVRGGPAPAPETE